MTEWFWIVQRFDERMACWCYLLHRKTITEAEKAMEDLKETGMNMRIIYGKNEDMALL